MTNNKLQYMPDNTSITIRTDTRERLEQMKIHRRESMNDVVERLLDEHDKTQKNKITKNE
jgi:predicted CopG family antitoxin